MVRAHQRFFRGVQILLDGFTLMLAYAAGVLAKLVIDHSHYKFGSHLVSPFWMIPTALVVFHAMHAYSPMRSRSFRQEALIIAKAHLAAIVVIFSVQFLLKDPHYSRKISLCFASMGLLFLLLERFVIRRILRYLRQKGYNQKHLLILGAGPLGAEFAAKVRAQPDFGYNVVGFLDDEAGEERPVIEALVLGGCDLLPSLLEDRTVDEVAVALPINSYRRYSGIVETCERAGVRVRIIPDYYQFLPPGTHPHIEEFDGMPLINVRRIPLDDPFSRFLKRSFDIAVSSAAILLTSPVMACIAIGIKLTSPGPLLFRQKRIGLKNQPFDMLKFRTMRVDTASTAATTWTVPNDPRTTRFGAFLRKTSLDELPQFFNVLFADMSVIGPRPERPFFVDQFREEIPKYMVKHQVKPGITGWAQVNGWRGDTSIKKRIECDLYYIENWALLLDIKIMFLTVFKGMVNRNAY